MSLKTNKEIVIFDNEMKVVNAELISSDMRYQRQVSGRVKKIASNFNPNMVGCVILSQREDGSYWVVDGQHRVRAIIIAHKNDPTVSLKVNALVYHGMTPQDEAEMFANQHDNTKAPSKPEFFKAKMFSGDKNIAAFKNATEQEGVICDFLNSRKKDGYLVSYGAAYEVFTKRGEQHYRGVISALIDIWDGNKDSLTANFIKGMDLIQDKYAGVITMKELGKSLRKVPTEQIERNAKTLTGSAAKRYAVAMVSEYNNRKRAKKLDIGLLA